MENATILFQDILKKAHGRKFDKESRRRHMVENSIKSGCNSLTLCTVYNFSIPFRIII